MPRPPEVHLPSHLDSVPRDHLRDATTPEERDEALQLLVVLAVDRVGNIVGASSRKLPAQERDDIVQDVLHKMLRSLSTCQASCDGQFWSWVRTITVHTIFDYLRRGQGGVGDWAAPVALGPDELPLDRLDWSVPVMLDRWGAVCHHLPAAFDMEHLRRARDLALLGAVAVVEDQLPAELDELRKSDAIAATAEGVRLQIRCFELSRVYGFTREEIKPVLGLTSNAQVWTYTKRGRLALCLGARRQLMRPTCGAIPMPVRAALEGMLEHLSP